MGVGVRGVGVVVFRVIDLVVQALLIAISVIFLASEVDPANVIGWLGVWCLVGTLYLIVANTIVWWTVGHPVARVSGAAEALERWPVVRLTTSLATFATAAMGTWAAVVLLVLRNDPTWGPWVNVIAVWAMLLAWALLHWGFARIYQQRYAAADVPPMRFPGAERPRFADFLYFSFTCGTAFSVSDVEVQTTRMRWIVMWHTVIGFFLNALIIVLAVNTIID